MFFQIGVLRNYSHFTGKRLQTCNCEICEILKNTFFYRTPPVAASELLTTWITSMGLTMKTILDRIIYLELEKNLEERKMRKNDHLCQRCMMSSFKLFQYQCFFFAFFFFFKFGILLHFRS